MKINVLVKGFDNIDTTLKVSFIKTATNKEGQIV